MKFGFLLIWAAAAVSAGEWPQFRGPDGTGLAPDAKPPVTWSEEQNVKWKLPLPYAGHSSPVVENGIIYFTGASKDKLERRLIAVDAESGRMVFDELIYRVTSNEVERCHEMNSFATPSPIVQNGRVYLTFGRHGTLCYDAAKRTKVWERRDLYVDYYDVGPASSPILYKDKLILNCDGAATNKQYVIAFDTATGRTVWKTDRSFVSNTVPKYAHASCVPRVIDVEGEPQLVSPGAHGFWVYNPETGEELWKVRFEGWSTVPYPVFAEKEGVLLVCSGVVRPAMAAVKVSRKLRGDITGSPAVLWRVEKDVPDMPSPLYYNGNFYLLTKNALFRRDVMTGAVLDVIKPTGQFVSSPVLADGKLFFFARGKQSYAVEAAPGLAIVGTNRLDAGCQASPSIYKNSLIVRTADALYRLEKTQ